MRPPRFCPLADLGAGDGVRWVEYDSGFRFPQSASYFVHGIQTVSSPSSEPSLTESGELNDVSRRDSKKMESELTSSLVIGVLLQSEVT